MDATRIDGRRVVAHFRGGRVLKGTTHDFAPLKAEFHLYEDGDEKRHATKIVVNELKALFFVRSFEGDSGYDESKSFGHGGGQGRKMAVAFPDGEVLVGTTMGYVPGKPGFFLVPADPASNNVRIYVVAASVESVQWIDGTSTGPRAQFAPPAPSGDRPRTR